MRQPWPVSLQGFSLRICVCTHLYRDLQLRYRPQREEYPDSRSKERTQAVPMNCYWLFLWGLHDLKFYPWSSFMHFADGATSYLRPVLMDGFYPHFAGYLGLQMWWLGSHQLSPRKVAASDWARTCNLRLGDWRSSLCRYGGFPQRSRFWIHILKISRNLTWYVF